MKQSVAAIIFGTHLGIERRYASIWREYRKQYPDADLDVYCNKGMIKLLEGSGFTELESIKFKPMYGFFGELMCSLISLYSSFGELLNRIPLVGKYLYKAVRVTRALKLGILQSFAVRKLKNYKKVHYVNSWIWPQKYLKGPELIFSMVNTQTEKWLPGRTSTIKAIVKHDVHLDCFSPDIERQIKDIFQEHGLKITCGPGSAVDPSRYKVAPKEKIVAYSTRFDPEKNPLIFVEALSQVKEVHPDVKVLMLGKGFMEWDIKAAVENYGMEERFDIKYVLDPCVELANVLVYVTLNTTNNYPTQALIEAMGCGCYSVASDVGETELLISDELKTGKRVQLDVDDTAKAILDALNDIEKTQQWGMNARELVLSSHTPKIFCEYLNKIYMTNE